MRAEIRKKIILAKIFGCTVYKTISESSQICLILFLSLPPSLDPMIFQVGPFPIYTLLESKRAHYKKQIFWSWWANWKFHFKPQTPLCLPAFQWKWKIICFTSLPPPLPLPLPLPHLINCLEWLFLSYFRYPVISSEFLDVLKHKLNFCLNLSLLDDFSNASEVLVYPCLYVENL